MTTDNYIIIIIIATTFTNTFPVLSIRHFVGSFSVHKKVLHVSI